MKQLLLIAMLAISQLTFGQKTDVLYVAIKSGLNLREKPDVNAKVLDKIPYATKVNFLDNNEELITIKTEGLIGYWRKVNYNNKTGYIVDSYLFPVAPPKAGVKTMKEYLAQLSSPFGAKQVVKSGDEENETQLEKQLFKNGGEWHHFAAYEYSSDTYFLPQFTMQEAFLLIRMIPEFAEVFTAKDEYPRESTRIKKGNTDYDIKVEIEIYMEEPWVNRIRVDFEHGAIYSFELYQIDSQIVVYFGGGV